MQGEILQYVPYVGMDNHRNSVITNRWSRVQGEKDEEKGIIKSQIIYEIRN